MDNALGDFLRARRELVTPAEVGLPPGNGLRRVPGLRREEVAMLAGISIDYYLRLERGRDRSPSARVAGALASVLQLDEESTEYLMTLSGRAAQPAPARDEDLPPGLATLVRTLNVPCVVFNRYCDVLAANPHARELAPFLRPGANLLRAIFLGGPEPLHRPEPAALTAGAVAHLRALCGTDTDDPRLHALIGELSLKSTRFRRLWARHDVHRGGSGTIVIRHPHAGDLELETQKLIVAGAPGLEVLVLHAQPGSRSADALAALHPTTIYVD
ncbi:transcriptional regulator with XRE-family HTH domain [Catenuloplanes nepalensis]|uniref:Transcriptional regulator with XRE-family HTH domain n=1 Tax=Catenuloplanes nepalensis TaxID=587533 RepID=A0ABT9MMJ3_9ACTN|nr:helix-turn-helix transcriptional regulator [Catenuloplanes nepalensis]MDP9792650.1 transcriptional regulator with XRE-family HTH domain [Catenuloplanes nepalensis]